MTILFWFRRDLRVQDNEALTAAVARANTDDAKLLASYVFSEDFDELSPIRRNSLITSVRNLNGSLPQGLSISSGKVETALVGLCQQHGVKLVFATRSFDTKGMLEQSAVAEALYAVGISLQLVGSNYAVEPGTVRKEDGSPIRVYTPFILPRLRTTPWKVVPSVTSTTMRYLCSIPTVVRF